MRLRTAPELASSGDAIARDDSGRVVFVAGAAPNELVEVTLVAERKAFARATVDEIIEPSEDRVEPPCPHFGNCGGCTLQHVSPQAQTRSKNAAAIAAIERIGRADPKTFTVEPPWSGAPYGYRGRARFAVAPGGVVGFRASKRKTVVDIETCAIVSPPLNEALALLRQGSKSLPRIEEVDAIASGDQALVRLPNRFAAKLQSAGAVEFVRGRTRRTLTHRDAHGTLELAPGVFSQNNAAGNEALVAYACQLVPDHCEVVELYAGSGNLSRALARRAANLITVEGSPDAVRLAKKILPKHVDVREMAVEAAADIATSIDVLVLNPPRTGLSDAALDVVRSLSPKSLIYVSCNPATFARDLARLERPLKSVKVFDLYPQTTHVELVAALG